MFWSLPKARLPFCLDGVVGLAGFRSPNPRVWIYACDMGGSFAVQARSFAASSSCRLLSGSAAATTAR
jgi:hypothetical protein